MAFRRVLSRVASSVRQTSKPRDVIKAVEDAAPHRLSSTLPQRVPELVDLRDTMEEVVPEQRERLAEIKAKHGDMVLGDVTVNMALGGMRGIKGLLWETSQLDPLQGIKFRGLSILSARRSCPPRSTAASRCPRRFCGCCSRGRCPRRTRPCRSPWSCRTEPRCQTRCVRCCGPYPRRCTPCRSSP
ncbi:hypothetical protein CLOP_g13777 [Closterium sp. NIES-67]|nr:hypothetical protein CLOP_g13777 [Closterium sp. NIES-67]